MKYLPNIKGVNPELNGDKISCIYFLLMDSVVVYVGQTCDLRTRICSHKSRGFFNEFRFIKSSELDKDYYERRWIFRFKPKLNRLMYNGDGGGYMKGIFPYNW